MMARQKLDASARKPPTLAPSRRRLGDLRDWLIVAWVLWWSWAYMQRRPGATFSALAGLDASAVVIVSHAGVMKRKKPVPEGPAQTAGATTGLEKSEKRGVQAARNGPSEDRKCWQRVELGTHGLNR